MPSFAACAWLKIAPVGLALLCACESSTTPTDTNTGGAASVSVRVSSATLRIGEVAQVIGEVRDARGNVLTDQVLTWSTSAPGVASVSGTGLVVAVTSGQATISGSASGKTGTVAVTVSAQAADAATLNAHGMLREVRNYIANALAQNQALLPNNPNSATYIQRKIDTLSQPALAEQVIFGGWYAAGTVASRNGRAIPIADVYMQASMRNEATAAVSSLQLALPILEDFFDLPFPVNTIRIWHGFILGNSGGGGVLNMEDQATYESRTPATRLPYEAILHHELSHSYISNESLNQFLEIYVYNRVHGSTTSFPSWTYVRGYTPFNPNNAGVHALLDIYQLIGFAAMERAYRAIYPLHPPYGVALSQEVKQAFIDAAPAAQKTQVGTLTARI